MLDHYNEQKTVFSLEILTESKHSSLSKYIRKVRSNENKLTLSYDIRFISALVMMLTKVPILAALFRCIQVAKSNMAPCHVRTAFALITQKSDRFFWTGRRSKTV